MRLRVRAAGIILNDKKELLLVLHKNPYTGDMWWTFPGGGLEGRESAEEAVVREVKEECGLCCTPGRLIYVREFLGQEEDVHHVELFFTAEVEHCNIIKGTDPELTQQYIIETRFLSRKEIAEAEAEIYPEILRNSFWDDLESGFSGQTVYLGLHE